MLYFLFAVIIILLALYMMPIVIRANVNKDNKNDKITLELRTLYGLLKLKTEIPFLTIVFENGKPALKYKIEIANKERSRLLGRFTKLLSLDEGGNLFKIYRDNKKIIKKVLKYITAKTKINNFCLKLRLGVGDAAVTGVLFGVLWILLGNIITFTSCHTNLKEPKIVIVPLFGQVQIEIDFSCIISIRLGHIINAGIRTIPAILSIRRKKE